MRTALLFAVVAALFAAPWPIVVALGWDTDLGLITRVASPNDTQVLHVVGCVLARMSLCLVAPIWFLAGVIRLSWSLTTRA